MNNIWTIFRYELTRNLKRRAYLLVTFGLPVLLLVGVLGFSVYQELRPEPTEEAAEEEELDLDGIELAGYVDLSGVFGDQVPESLAERLAYYETETAARAALNADEIDVFYVVPEDYLEEGEIFLHMPRLQFSLLNSQAMEQFFFESVAGDLDPEIVNRLRNPARIQQFDIARDSEAERNADADLNALYIFLAAFGVGMFFTNTYLMQSVIEEKESRLIEILIVTVRPNQLLIGKILAMAALGLFQVLVWLVGGFIVANIALQLPAFSGIPFALSLPGDSLLIPALYFVLTYLLFAAIYGGIGTVSNSMTEGPQYAALFTLPTFVPVYFIPVFTENTDFAMMNIMSFFPLTAPTAMLIRISSTPVSATEIALSVALLALTVVFAMWIVGRLFRVQTLLRGSTPNLRQIISLIVSDDSPRKAKQ